MVFGLGKVRAAPLSIKKCCIEHNMQTLQMHEFVLGHDIGESFVGCNMSVFFKSIIDMQMIWRWSSRAAGYFKMSGVWPVNKSSHPNLSALSMKMLGLLQDNYSRHSTNMSNKTSQRVFSVQPRRETFIIPLLQSLGDVTCLLKSRCIGCWLTDLWNIQGWYMGAQRSVYVPLSFSFLDSLHVLKHECSHRPQNSYNKKSIPVGVLWGYHTCRMCWIKKPPTPQKTSHILSGIVGVKSRKA